MTKILAILILSSSFKVAIETSDGFVERSFINSREGVSKFLTFAAPHMKTENIKLCAVPTVKDPGSVMRLLTESGLRVGFLTYPSYRAYAEEAKSDPSSAVTVAHACVARFVVIP